MGAHAVSRAKPRRDLGLSGLSKAEREAGGFRNDPLAQESARLVDRELICFPLTSSFITANSSGKEHCAST
jgi:hypothetical protein